MLGGIMGLLQIGALWSRIRALAAPIAQGVGNLFEHYPWQVFAGLLLIGNIVQDHIHRHDVAQLDAMKAAQAGATKAQADANHKPAADSQAIARQSDAQAPDYYADAASAAAAHVVRVRAAPCPISPAGVPGPDPVAPIDDRSGGPTAVVPDAPVCRPKADDDKFIAAASRLAKVHQDAEALIAAGVAVPDDVP